MVNVLKKKNVFPLIKVAFSHSEIQIIALSIGDFYIVNNEKLARLIFQYLKGDLPI